jgi:hypothetical protein
MPPSRLPASLHALAQRLRSSQCSSHSLAAAAINAAKTSPHGCFSDICEDAAYHAAAAADKRFAAGAALGRLDGVPFAIKDNFCTEFGRTTARCARCRLFAPLSPLTIPQLARSLELPAVLQRDGGAAAAGRGRRARWKDRDGRVWHGLIHPQQRRCALKPCFCCLRPLA